MRQQYDERARKSIHQSFLFETLPLQLPPTGEMAGVFDLRMHRQIIPNKTIYQTSSSAGLDVDNSVLEGPPRSFADLLALLLVADQVQSIVDQQTKQDHGDNSVANLSFLPFVQLPSRNFCLPSFSEDDGVLN
jgi:hypothetical protein